MLLDRGIRDFQRETYRGPHFMGGLGYDVVRYDNTPADSSQSFLLAYKARTGPSQVGIGQEDRRPLFAIYVIAVDANQAHLTVEQDRVLIKSGAIDRESALAQLVAQTDQATPLSSSRPRQ